MSDRVVAIRRGWRYQPPAYSPVPFCAPLAAASCFLPFVRDPREDLRSYLAAAHGATEVVLCGSGTQALLLALRLVSRRQQRQITVALPAYSCYDVASAAVAAGVRVQLYDLDPASLGPALESLEAVLREGVDAVVAAHLYGLPLDWQAVSALSDTFGATLIEDAAQGFGATWAGRPLGSLGDLAVLSFGRGKGWTGARGGALLLKADCVADVPAEALRRTTTAEGVLIAATAAALGLLSHPAVYGVPASLPGLRLGETIYRDVAAPVRMSAAAASLLQSGRVAAEREAAMRRSTAAAMLAALWPRPGVAPLSVTRSADPGYLRLPIRIQGGMSALPGVAVRLGVAPGYPAPLSALAPLRPRLQQGAPTPGAADLVRTLVTLPTHTRLTRAERAKVLRLVNSARADG